MLRLSKKASAKTSLPPGTLVHIGERKTEKIKVTIMDYSESHFEEKVAEAIQECFPFRDKPTVTWINVDGIHDVEVIERIGECFGLHPLLLEDILNTQQRPKAEDFGNYIFVVLKMPYVDEEEMEVTVEQVSLVLGSNFVLSFQEQEGDVFDAIRDRIRKKKGRVRKNGADYLAYCLIDAIVDSYFGIVEVMAEGMEGLEECVIANPQPDTLRTIHTLKREIIFLRKSVWPLREIVSALQRKETPLIRKPTEVYLRDVHDHAIQIIDTIETLRDVISGLRDTYLSSLSNRMNEVMKVLTIFASIFIPLTFFAGIYGMNFKYMPELDWRWSYPTLLVVLVGVGVTMLSFFRRKRWL